MPAKAKLLRALQVAACLGLALLLWRAADGQAALTHLQGAHLGWLSVAGAALLIQTLLSARRWQITADRLGLSIPAGTAVREYFLAQAVNQSLPGGVLGDANRAVRARGPAGWKVSAQAVVFERITGQLGLLAVLAFGLLLWGVVPDMVRWPVWLWTPLAITLGAVLVGGLCVAGSATARRAVAVFADAVWAPGVRVQQIGLSLGTAFCNVAGFAFCALALGVSLSVTQGAALIPLILFAMLVPLSIAGWGVREGAAVLVLPLVGATSAEALAISVAFGLVFLLTTLPGVIFPLMRPNAPVRPGASREKLTTDEMILRP
ncbi:MAG: lysylphosphatidylglycerol synthase transmembrane domain-containing protein [Pseudomonadota bacterium]